MIFDRTKNFDRAEFAMEDYLRMASLIKKPEVIWPAQPHYKSVSKMLYMAQHQGLLFQCKEGPEQDYYSLTDMFFPKPDRHGDTWTYRLEDFHIHPTSLPLLEPRAGDYGGDGEISGTVISVISVNGGIVCIDVMGCPFCMKLDRFRIERRNGEAFFTPERGE